MDSYWAQALIFRDESCLRNLSVLFVSFILLKKSSSDWSAAPKKNYQSVYSNSVSSERIEISHPQE